MWTEHLFITKLPMASGAIRFENESSIEERKRARQEEWERVRTESDPIQAPEQEICNKTLFEQLQVRCKFMVLRSLQLLKSSATILFNCSWTKFIAIILHVLVFFLHVALSSWLNCARDNVYGSFNCSRREAIYYFKCKSHSSVMVNSAPIFTYFNDPSTCSLLHNA